MLRGCWRLPGHCSFCRCRIGTAVALIVTQDRLGAACNRCDYDDCIAERLGEIADRDGFLRQISLPGVA